MPFDGRYISTPAMRRAILISALRHPMPPEFTWDYGCFHTRTACGTTGCALGLARTIFPDERRLRRKFWRPFKAWAEVFGITPKQAGRIFCSRETYHVQKLGDVTPHQVADQLEKVVQGEKV